MGRSQKIPRCYIRIVCWSLQVLDDLQNFLRARPSRDKHVPASHRRLPTSPVLSG